MSEKGRQMQVNTENSLTVTLKRFLNMQADNVRLFCLHATHYDKREAENQAMFASYLRAKREGRTPSEPVFLESQFLIEMECIDTPHAIHQCNHAVVMFAVSRGMIADIVLRRALRADETSIPTSASFYVLITYRLVDGKDNETDDGTDTVTFLKQDMEQEGKPT